MSPWVCHAWLLLHISGMHMHISGMHMHISGMHMHMSGMHMHTSGMHMYIWHAGSSCTYQACT